MRQSRHKGRRHRIVEADDHVTPRIFGEFRGQTGDRLSLHEHQWHKDQEQNEAGAQDANGEKMA